MISRERHDFGKQVVWVEGTDLLWAQFRGQVLGEELRAMLDFRNEWSKDRPYYFVVADLSGSSAVDLEARRVMASERAVVDTRQISIYFGASFTIRTIAQMMFRALALLRPDVRHTERNFVATEAEARALIEKKRKERFDEEAHGASS